MILKKIRAVITQEQELQVINFIKEARTLLNFLVGLTSLIRVRLAKLSRGHVDFVDTALIEMKANPDYKPAYFTVEEFDNDVKLKNSLHRIRVEVASLNERIDDTILMVESEAYRKARLFYKSVKAAGKEGAEDAERIAKELSYHYKRLGHAKNIANGDDSNQE